MYSGIMLVFASDMWVTWCCDYKTSNNIQVRSLSLPFLDQKFSVLPLLGINTVLGAFEEHLRSSKAQSTVRCFRPDLTPPTPSHGIGSHHPLVNDKVFTSFTSYTVTWPQQGLISMKPIYNTKVFKITRVGCLPTAAHKTCRTENNICDVMHVLVYER